jgi:hypothetical protein
VWQSVGGLFAGPPIKVIDVDGAESVATGYYDPIMDEENMILDEVVQVNQEDVESMVVEDGGKKRSRNDRTPIRAETTKQMLRERGDPTITSPPRNVTRINPAHHSVSFHSHASLDEHGFRDMLSHNSSTWEGDIISHNIISIFNDPSSHITIVGFRTAEIAAKVAADLASNVDSRSHLEEITTCLALAPIPTNLAEYFMATPGVEITRHALHCLIPTCPHHNTHGENTFFSTSERATHWHKYHPAVLAQLSSGPLQLRAYLGMTLCPHATCGFLCVCQDSYNQHVQNCQFATTTASATAMVVRQDSGDLECEDGMEIQVVTVDPVGNNYALALQICPASRCEAFKAQLLTGGPYSHEEAVEMAIKEHQDEKKSLLSPPF